MSNLPDKKNGFKLKPKHLVIAVLVLGFITVAGLIVSVFNTIGSEQPAAASSPQQQKTEDRVEVWQPRGAGSHGNIVINPDNTGLTQPKQEGGLAASQASVESGNTAAATTGAAAAALSNVQSENRQRRARQQSGERREPERRRNSGSDEAEREESPVEPVEQETRTRQPEPRRQAEQESQPEPKPRRQAEPESRQESKPQQSRESRENMDNLF
ncbi:hypothetical protein [Neisseria sp.]|uniref:hypothetical protein n=1 Tax=Neisseria sp. TaxID=192066 RepID=UPI0035A1291F